MKTSTNTAPDGAPNVPIILSDGLGFPGHNIVTFGSQSSWSNQSRYERI